MSTDVAVPWWRRVITRTTMLGLPITASGKAVATGATGSTFAYPLRGDSPAEYKRDGTTVRKKGFEQHPVVNACVRAISDIIMAVPFETYRRATDGEITVITTAEPQLILDAPSSTVSSARLRHITAAHFLMYGNAFWYLLRNGDGSRPYGIQIVHPENVMAIYADAYGVPSSYQWTTDVGFVMTTPAKDIVHFRDIPSGKTSVFGFPRAASALNDIIGDNEASQYVRQVVTNDGTPTLAMLVNEDTTQEEARVAEQRWHERMVGRGQRGRTAFVGGIRDIKVIGFNLSDLEFPDLRRIAREDICAAFGVDPRMIGIGSASSDGGMSGIQYQEARVRLIQHTIEPIMETFVSEMNLWLMPEWGDWYVRFSPKRLAALVENDQATSDRVLKELSANARTLQEAREALGLPTEMDPFHVLVTNGMMQLMPVAMATPIVGELSEDDETADVPKASAGAVAAGAAEGMPLDDVQAQALNGAQITALVDLLKELAANMLPPDAVAALIKIAFPTIPSDLVQQLMDGMYGFEQPSASAPSAPSASTSAPSSDSSRDLATTSAGARFVRSSAALMSREQRTELWRAFDARATKEEASYRRAALMLFKDERMDIDKIFSAEASNASSRATKPKAGQVGKDDPYIDAAMRRVKKNYKKDGPYHKRWAERYKSLIGKTYTTSAQDIAATMGVSFTLENPKVQAAIVDRAERLATYVTDTTSKQITRVVAAGRKAGMGIGDISRLINKSVFGGVSASRSTMIARTETIGAMNQGEFDLASTTGAKTKEWLTQGDDRVREDHDLIDGQRIPVDDDFPIGVRYPGDQMGAPDQVINCRCTLLYYDD